MDIGTVQSGKTTGPPADSAIGTGTGSESAAAQAQNQTQNEIAMEDSEILRRLVRLLSKSEEDELFAQDANRQPSSSALHSHTFHRSKSEGDSTSVHLNMNRSRSILRLTDTAPLRISRPPKVELAETYQEFERNLVKLRTKIKRFQNVLRGWENGASVSKAVTEMSLHLENVTSYMKQQVELLAQADTGPPSEDIAPKMFDEQVHARNLTSALSSLAQSTRALSRALSELQDDGMLDDVDDFDALENLAQLAESEARSLKDSKADESLKRMSGIRFRRHSAELNAQFTKAYEDATLCLSGIIKSIIPAARARRERENQQHLIRTGIALLFSVVTAMMLSVSVDRGTSSLNLATSGVWLVSLTCGVAAGITGVVGMLFSESSLQDAQRTTGKPSRWIAKGSEVFFLLAIVLFSVGLCIFAFSSAQATAARAVVITITTLHFIGLFVILVWLLRTQPTPARNADLIRDGSHRNRKRGRGRRGGMWSSMRKLAQLSIHTSVVGGPADGRGSSRRGSKARGREDVEQGLGLSSPKGESVYRRSATPIIRVTDTDQEAQAQAQAQAQQAAASANGDRDQLNTNEHGSPPANVHARQRSTANRAAHDADSDSNSDSDSDSDETSENGSQLTSLSFSHHHTHPTALTIPSAQRMSSDSSRSLPALPADVLVARCMAYSPNGMFLCIGNASPQERCTIFSADSPAITLGELKLTDVARQIEWSMDGENILLRLTHAIYVWNAMPSNGSRRPAIIIYQESDNVKWLINGDSFLSCEKDILTSFHVDGTPTGVYQIPSSLIQDFVVTKDGHRIICLVSNFASARSGATAASTQKLVVYNLDNKAIEQIAPVGREAMSVVHSTVSPDLILVNFGGTTPPQIWRYRENTDAAERRTSATFLSFKRAMSFKAPAGRFSGYGIFGNADDRLILSLGEDGDMFIFVSDTGQPLRHITTSTSIGSHPDRKSLNGSQVESRRGRPLEQCVAWDPDILTFTICMGYSDGSILQWKIPLDAINQDPSTFTVVNLSDGDSTLIRPADVVKPMEDQQGDSQIR